MDRLRTRPMHLLALTLLLGWLVASQVAVHAHEATHWLHDTTELCDDYQLAHHSPALVAPITALPSAQPLAPLEARRQPALWVSAHYPRQQARAPPLS